MKELVGILGKAQLLSALPEDVIEGVVIPAGRVAEYQKGAAMIAAQERVDTLRVVLSGRVNAMHLFADGSYGLAAQLGPLAVLGVDLVCTRTRVSPYHAVAAEHCRVFAFGAELLLTPGMLPEPGRQAVLSELLLTISQLNMQKEYRLAILSQNGLRERVTIYLSMQAARRRSTSFSIPFSREEMAAFLCVNRSALSHELSRMRAEGIIDFRKNRFTLLKGVPDTTF